MDLIVDSKQHVILTPVERSTNMLLMQRIPTGKKAEPIAKAAVKQLFPYRGTIKTITTDNGSEFAAHQLITKGLYMKGKEDVKVYFTDAYSSWQKGCIENTNKLIRKYSPKRADFNQFSDLKIMNIQKKTQQKTTGKIELLHSERLLLQLFSLTLHKITFVIGQYSHQKSAFFRVFYIQKFAYLTNFQYLCSALRCAYTPTH